VSTPARCLVGILLLAILVVGGIALLHSGLYGWTIFTLLPVTIGGLASWIDGSATGGRAARLGALTVAGATCCLLVLGLEGFICIAICLPLAMPLGALGGWLVYRAGSSQTAARGGIAMLLLLPPASLTWDVQARPPVFEVRSAITIAAPPERVWKYVVAFSEMPGPREWFFRAGLAYPTRARMEGHGAGAVRYCDFSTGPVVEPIVVWDEPHLLRFRVTATPAPMREWSPYAEVSPKHLHGYLISRLGEFRLTRLPGNRTLLEGTTWYQHGLWPAQYWRWWSDAAIHRIHLRVFNHIRTLAERGE
jgi:uncharacterized protein YndB with AHSA1/START domain